MVKTLIMLQQGTIRMIDGTVKLFFFKTTISTTFDRVIYITKQQVLSIHI